MKELKNVMLGDFTKAETNYLSELILEYLTDMEIEVESFAFHIEVEYIEAEEE
tara:strand:- start:116 stop:274 length:159 start_codon:yes stop_codon:yes gene_type:complete